MTSSVKVISNDNYFDGFGTDSKFYNPTSIIYDNNNNKFYVGDSMNNIIRALESGGSGNSGGISVGTVVGDGSKNYDDSILSYTDCKFNYPSYIDKDSNGNIYVADTNNNVIRKILLNQNDRIIANQDGTTGYKYTITIAGDSKVGKDDGDGTVASFNKPSGVCVASNGDIYVSDSGNNTIRKITKSVITNTKTFFAGQRDILLPTENNNNIIDDSNQSQKSGDGIRDIFNQNINYYGFYDKMYGTYDGYNFGFRVTPSIGSTKPIKLQITTSNYTDFDPSNWEIYGTNGGINGDYTLIAEGSITTTNSHPYRTLTYDFVNTVSYTSYKIKFPFKAGFIRLASIKLIEDVYENLTYGYDTYNVSTVCGKSLGDADGNGTNAKLYNPTCIIRDSSDNLYVSDTNNHKIKKITLSNGVYTCQKFSGSVRGYEDASSNNTTVKFNKPTGLCLDSNNNLYITDSINNRIRKISSSGVVTTVAGSLKGYSDATGTNSRFNQPSGLCLDQSGNIYVTDLGNSLIRKISSSGEVTTVAGNISKKLGNKYYIKIKSPESKFTDFNGYFFTDDNGTIKYFYKENDNSFKNYILQDGEYNYVKVENTGVNYEKKISVPIIYDDVNYHHGVIGMAPYQNMGRLYKNTLVNYYYKSGWNQFDTKGICLDGTMLQFFDNYSSLRSILKLRANSSNNLYNMTTKLDSYYNYTRKEIYNTNIFRNYDYYLRGTYSSCFDSNGNMYIANVVENKIKKIDANGNVTVFAGNSQSAGDIYDGIGINSAFNHPLIIVIDSSKSNLYVLDNVNDPNGYNSTSVNTNKPGVKIRKIEISTGTVTTIVSNLTEDYNCRGMTIDSNDNLYVSGYDSIWKILNNANRTSQKIIDNQFTTLRSITVDTSGNLYVLDRNRVKKIDTSLNITTIAGGGSGYGDVSGYVEGDGTNAAFYEPDTITIDSQGNLYVVESFMCSIRKIFNDANRTMKTLNTIWGGPGTGKTFYIAPNSIFDGNLLNSKYVKPLCLTLKSDNEMYLFDSGNISKITKEPEYTMPTDTIDVLIKISANKDTTPFDQEVLDIEKYYNFFFDGKLLGEKGPKGPKGLLGSTGLQGIKGNTGPTGPNGDIGPKSTEYGSIGSNGLNGPTGPKGKNNLVVGPTGPTGKFYAWKGEFNQNTEYHNGDVFNKAGSAYVIREDINYNVKTVGGSVIGFKNGMGTNAEFSEPRSVILDINNDYIIADSSNNVIRKMDFGTKSVVNIAGNLTKGFKDGEGTEALFYSPEGMCIDSENNIYICDTYNHAIRKLSLNMNTYRYMVTTIAGSGKPGYNNDFGTNAQFNEPRDIICDSNGCLYVCDSGNNCIRKILKDNSVTTFAGNDTNGFLDGEGTACFFHNPQGIDIDDNGNLYIADTYNNRIRKITKNGIVTTVAGNYKKKISDGVGSNASFENPISITTCKGNILYIADNNIIRKIDLNNNQVSTFAGKSDTGKYAFAEDGYIYQATFGHIYGITTDSFGNLYIADTTNCLIRTITKNRIDLLVPRGKGPKGPDGPLNVSESNTPPSTTGIPGQIIICGTDMYMCSSNCQWFKISGLTKIV